MNVESIAFTVSVWAIPVLLAITLHEAAHGFVAWRLGDDTAYRLGRVTFNPFRHIDPFGTVIMPALLLFASDGRILFGYAKPVPVAFHRLNRPRRDMVLVAAAGPATNLALSLASAALIHALPIFGGEVKEWVAYNILNSVWINVLLCVFNMLPIPPLDGGRVAVGVLPQALSDRLARTERVGMFVILGAMFLLPWIGDMVGMNLNVFGWLVGVPAEYLMGLILQLTGVK